MGNHPGPPGVHLLNTVRTDYYVIWSLVDVSPPRQPILQAVGQVGDPADHALRVERGGGLDGDVLDDDEVLLAPQDADGEVAVGHPRIELEQDPAVAIVGRPADRDQREEGPALGVGPGRADVDGLLAVEPRGDGDAASRGWTGRRRSPSDATKSRIRRSTSGSAGSGASYVPSASAPSAGVGLHATQRQPAADAEPVRLDGWPACNGHRRS